MFLATRMFGVAPAKNVSKESQTRGLSPASFGMLRLKTKCYVVSVDSVQANLS